MSRFSRKVKNRNGFTLVELLITLSLLGIVLSIVFNFFFYGQNSFQIGEKQSNVQREVRLASNRITGEIRNAVELTFVSSSATDQYNYIVYDQTKKTLKIISKGSTIYETYPVISNVTYKIYPVNGKYVLEFTIEGTEGSQKYITRSEVYLVNLEKEPLNPERKVIKYMLPQES